jgi:hypothetical protein
MRNPPMKLKAFLRGFVVYFVVVFIVSAIVSYLYALIAHGEGVVDWESSVRFGFILGIALPLIPMLNTRKQ